MANDQQFCLRWNNHQTTLVEIFDKLLSNDRLVDCTLAAEGQYLRAHKVLLSACSPYFELLLSQHNDKHPIIILKDVTFRELRALMDYMYRGEVNVSQDQLGALLKVAENLQIKGLSDSGGGGTEPKDNKPPDKRPLPPPPPAQQQTPIIPRPGLTIEHHRSNQLDLSHDSPSALDGSPVPRKRKRMRRRSSDDESSLGHTPVESHHDSSSRESSSLSIPPNVASNPLSKSAAVIPEPPPVLDRTDHILPEPAQPIQDVVHKTEPNTEMLLEPKHEYPDDVNEDSVEDLTLEDDVNDLNQSQAGPSGEGSSNQGFTPWHMATDRSTDEVFMQAQEAVGAQRDSQGEVSAWTLPVLVPLEAQLIPPLDMVDPQRFQCPTCSRSYKHKGNLNRHIREECGQDAPAVCHKCNKLFKYKRDLYMHIKEECGMELQHECGVCKKNFRHRSTLKHHIAYDCGKEPQFQCPIPHCLFRTRKKKGLTRHMKRPHKSLEEIQADKERRLRRTDDIGPFECPDCGRIYKHERNFSHHVKNDCGREPHYFCESCHKVYRHRTALYTHTKYECGKEPQFQCPQCPYRAKRKSSLKDHMHVHASHPLKFEDMADEGPVVKVEVCINEDIADVKEEEDPENDPDETL